jgi:hypothetical protein
MKKETKNLLWDIAIYLGMAAMGALIIIFLAK